MLYQRAVEIIKGKSVHYWHKKLEENRRKQRMQMYEEILKDAWRPGNVREGFIIKPVLRNSIGEASQAQTPSRYDHNVDPFKYVFKKTPKSDKERRAKTLAPRAADEPSTELHTALKRLDFDDPPQV
ncbi:hypothetical protein SUGI_1137200 [Cryptomeria japonica]|nr:hypothetical protein SUGI_1137200 [Cryptomeria japonica]